MSVRTLLAMVALLLGVMAVPVAAGDHKLPKWGEGAVWEIYVDPVPENGCYATRFFLSGAAMRIALRPDGDLHLAMGRSDWQFAEPGKTYRMKFVFGNGKTYEEDFDAVAVGSVTVLVRPTMSAAFVSDFMEKTSLVIYHRDSRVATVLLLDTYEAVTQLRTCNASRSGAVDPSDPSLR
jgi:hypothetical protein